MTDINPFRPNRIEHENRPILWLSTRSRYIARSQKPIYISGTRGSGKTSILRTLSTQHILTDPNLLEQYGHKLGSFGIFFQLNETFSPLIESGFEGTLRGLPADAPDDHKANMKFVFFSQYVELRILQRAFNSLHELRAGAQLSYSAAEEAKVVGELCSGALHFLFPRYGYVPETFRHLAILLQRYLGSIFNNAFWTTTGSVREASLYATEPGLILESFANAIVHGRLGDQLPRRDKGVVRVLIDDCEALTADQQIFLNSLIRKTRPPLTWAVSYIGGQFDPIGTVVPALGFSEADREIISLDDIRTDEFESLCQNVSSLRLYYALAPKRRRQLRKREPVNAFNLKARLGQFGLNELVGKLIRVGLAEAQEDLNADAHAASNFLQMAVKKGEWRNIGIQGESLPYTQAVTLKLMHDSYKSRIFDDRGLASFKRALERKSGWAFLEICRRLRLHNVPYVGYRIIISLSDSCIRDFLDIMGEIFEEAVLKNARFEQVSIEDIQGQVFRFADSESEIGLETQRIAVQRAAEKKFVNISTQAAPYENETSRLVRGLGRLTARLQLDLTAQKEIRTAEKGIYEIDMDRLRESARQLRYPEERLEAVIRRALKDGFVREVRVRERAALTHSKQRPEKRYIRVHRRFAPFFGFSFRGPYEVVRVPELRLMQLLVQGDSFDPDTWAAEAETRIGAGDTDDPRQGRLFVGAPNAF